VLLEAALFEAALLEAALLEARLREWRAHPVKHERASPMRWPIR
jgi:hypothetical protein